MGLKYDIIVVGGGPSGIFSAIYGARRGKTVLIVEKSKSLALKLLASGNGRANLTNTLDNDTFLSRVGHGKKEGLFLKDAFNIFDKLSLKNLFLELGLEIKPFDGFHIFPEDRSSKTVVDLLIKELKRLGVKILTSSKCEKILVKNNSIDGVLVNGKKYLSKSLVVATGGKGFPSLGGSVDGYNILRDIGHKITNLYPAMVKLNVKERWIENCRADTISNAVIKIDIKKYSKKSFKGDLIFTQKGLMGPLIQDFSGEVTPLFDKYDEVPLLINFVKGKNREEIYTLFKKFKSKDPTKPLLDHISTILPKPLILEFCKQLSIDPNIQINRFSGRDRENLIDLMVKGKLTVTGSEGFKSAMVTRGGVSLKEVNPKTMESKLIKNLYIVGEVLDIDGPCGGYNLQIAFSTGAVAGKFA
ncbi:MAG: aminoacetone oxidase family FAD-binding enzyme [Candidatus Cloacimonadota bacterium]|nr:MAG: aminoacetone oxidase family FAD-binding enzyme [Candidatus Cloacimonadota bacterium]PIE77822.1 MAG: aminoacetone oxidase family FAD-binding enzyme [Candidatus Delongbacteria bacterium]